MENFKLCLILLLIPFFSSAVGFDGLIKWVRKDAVGDESRKHCAEYSKFGKTDENDCHNNFLKTLDRNEAGEYTANPSDFPHMVVFGNSGFKTTCFGSLISEKFVLTVAQCTKRFMEHENGTDIIWAYIGNNTKTSSKAVTIKVAKIYIHPNFTLNPRQNDISLLELKDEVDFDEMKRPACIHTEKEVNGSTNISGWGIDRNTGEEITTKAPVLEKEMKIVLEGRILSKQLGRDDSMSIAMKNPGGKNDICEVDSGMPIVTTMDNSNCTYNVVGLRSHGRTCTQYVTMYTKVYSYVEWIENIVWSNFFISEDRKKPYFVLRCRYTAEFGMECQWSERK